jgi:hypothetical protein
VTAGRSEDSVEELRLRHEPTVGVSVYPSQLLQVEVLRRPLEPKGAAPG